MTKIRLRGLWFQFHKWIGIALAIILIPLSITGSMLVWDEPIDRLLQPSHYAVTGAATLPASAYIDAARRALPAGSNVVSMTIGAGPVTVSATPPQPGAKSGPPQRLTAWIDPSSGRVIGTGAAIAPLLRWAHAFHGSLQIPGFGRAVVGWLGMAMLLSSLTGIWLWWPMTGSVTRSFRWKRQPALDANLHHLVGFWISLPLAMLSLTGVIIAWPQMIGSSNGARRPMATPLAVTHLTINQLLATTPLRGRTTITWPTEKDPSWKIVGDKAAAANIDDATGKIVPGAGGGNERRRPFYRRLHDGTGMGPIWQFVIVLAGLAPAILGVTGIIMWLRTRGWRSEVAQRRATARPL